LNACVHAEINYRPQIEELLKQMEALRIELDRPPTMDEILAHERAPKGETDEIMRDLEQRRRRNEDRKGTKS
jgi:hypothetical protein